MLQRMIWTAVLGLSVLLLARCTEYEPITPEDLYSVFELDSGVELIEIDSTKSTTVNISIFFTPRYDLIDEALVSRIIVYRNGQKKFFLQSDRVSVLDVSTESGVEYTYVFVLELAAGGTTKRTTPITLSTL